MAEGIKKIAKLPQDLDNASLDHGILKMKGLSVVGLCTHSHGTKGTMYLQDHVLLFVLKGIYTVRFGDQEYTVRKNEMVLLQKAIVIEYEKYGEPDSEHTLDYMMFFIKDDLLDEFIKMSNHKPSSNAAFVPVSVKPMNERLISYIDSIKPYFHEKEKIEDGLIKLKLLELLYDVTNADKSFLCQFLQLKHKKPLSIVEVIEENLVNPVSLNDLAYLSGRSLSTFKREFQAIYNTSTFQWIRDRRLEKAKDMLTLSGVSVTDACFATGFENAAHFSKAFKKKFGIPPSAVKPSQNN